MTQVGERGPASTSRERLRALCALGGHLAAIGAAVVTVGALLEFGLIPHPLALGASAAGLWWRCATYLPLVVFAAMSLLWLLLAGAPARPWLGRGRWTLAFAVGLTVSIGYTAWLLGTRRHLLHWDQRWAPIAVFSALNAFTEELLFRLVTPRLVGRLVRGAAVPVLVSALLYASYHVLLGGWQLGAMALGYGVLMGVVTERARSVWPAILCHFLLDLGAIGFGMALRVVYLPHYFERLVGG